MGSCRMNRGVEVYKIWVNTELDESGVCRRRCEMESDRQTH